MRPKDIDTGETIVSQGNMETDRRRAEIRVGELDREGNQALEEINGSIKACLIFLFEIAGRVGLERGGGRKGLTASAGFQRGCEGPPWHHEEMIEHSATSTFGGDSSKADPNHQSAVGESLISIPQLVHKPSMPTEGDRERDREGDEVRDRPGRENDKLLRILSSLRKPHPRPHSRKRASQYLSQSLDSKEWHR
jgi:hypothetical protein